MKLTYGNITAMILGLLAFVPQIQALVNQGIAAFDGCRIASAPFLAGLLAFIAALSSKGIFEKKK